MKKIKLTFLSSLLLTIAVGQLKPQGTFIGLEQMKSYTDPSKPNYKWYRLSTLTFKSDSVFLEQSPIAIYKKDTLFSASDGGFYSYVGTFGYYEGKFLVDLKLKSCDYCPRQIVKFRPPKIVKDEDTTQITTSDNTITEEPLTIEYPNRENKIMVLEKTSSNDIIMVNKNIYKRQKRN